MSSYDKEKVRSNHENFCSMTNTWTVVIKLFRRGVLSESQKEQLVRKCMRKEEKKANGKVYVQYLTTYYSRNAKSKNHFP